MDLSSRNRYQHQGCLILPNYANFVTKGTNFKAESENAGKELALFQNMDFVSTKVTNFHDNSMASQEGVKKETEEAICEKEKTQSMILDNLSFDGLLDSSFALNGETQTDRNRGIDHSNETLNQCLIKHGISGNGRLEYTDCFKVLHTGQMESQRCESLGPVSRSDISKIRGNIFKEAEERSWCEQGALGKRQKNCFYESEEDENVKFGFLASKSAKPVRHRDKQMETYPVDSFQPNKSAVTNFLTDCSSIISGPNECTIFSASPIKQKRSPLIMPKRAQPHNSFLSKSISEKRTDSSPRPSPFPAWNSPFKSSVMCSSRSGFGTPTQRLSSTKSFQNRLSPIACVGNMRKRRVERDSSRQSRPENRGFYTESGLNKLTVGNGQINKVGNRNCNQNRNGVSVRPDLRKRSSGLPELITNPDPKICCNVIQNLTSLQRRFKRLLQFSKSPKFPKHGGLTRLRKISQVKLERQQKALDHSVLASGPDHISEKLTGECSSNGLLNLSRKVSHDLIMRNLFDASKGLEFVRRFREFVVGRNVSGQRRATVGWRKRVKLS